MKFRSKPNINSEKIGFMPYKTQIKILDDSSGSVETLFNKTGRWLKVEYEGKIGWVFGGFVEIEK